MQKCKFSRILILSLFLFVFIIGGCGFRKKNADGDDLKVGVENSKTNTPVQTIKKTPNKSFPFNENRTMTVEDAGGTGTIITKVQDNTRTTTYTNSRGEKVDIKQEKDKIELFLDRKEGKIIQKIGSLEESDFLVKFYPGAIIKNSYQSEIDIAEGKKLDQKTAILQTIDPIEKVKEFYVQQLDKPQVVEDEGKSYIITAIIKKESFQTEFSITISITRNENENKTDINISQSSGN